MITSLPLRYLDQPLTLLSSTLDSACYVAISSVVHTLVAESIGINPDWRMARGVWR